MYLWRRNHRRQDRRLVPPGGTARCCAAAAAQPAPALEEAAQLARHSWRHSWRGTAGGTAGAAQRYAIRDTRYEIRDTRYAIRDTRYARCGTASTARRHSWGYSEMRHSKHSEAGLRRHSWVRPKLHWGTAGLGQNSPAARSQKLSFLFTPAQLPLQAGWLCTTRTSGQLEVSLVCGTTLFSSLNHPPCSVHSFYVFNIHRKLK